MIFSSPRDRSICDRQYFSLHNYRREIWSDINYCKEFKDGYTITEVNLGQKILAIKLKIKSNKQLRS